MNRTTPISLLMIMLIVLSGCAMNMRTAGVTKYPNYHPPKKIAFLPAASEKSFAAERMNKINAQVMEGADKDGVIGVDRIKKFLGKQYSMLEKNPSNKKMLQKIARRYKIDTFVYCEVTDWQADVPVKGKEGSYLNKVGLTYTAVDAQTLKPLSKNSGSNEKTGTISEESVVAALAGELAAKLIKSL